MCDFFFFYKHHLLHAQFSVRQSCLCSASREMKKGNVGLALGMVGKKLRSSFGGSVDLGLTGKDGVVHPSLAVKFIWHIYVESFGKPFYPKWFTIDVQSKQQISSQGEDKKFGNTSLKCISFSKGSAVFYLQESAKKLEQNVNFFGSTVESLLYRYGKVTFDWFYILEKNNCAFPA